MKQRIISAALAAAFLAAPVASMAQETDLAKRVEQLAAELEKVKAELAAQRAQAAAPAAPAPVQAAQPAAAAPVATAATASVAPASDTVFSGYGEVNYNHTVRNASGDEPAGPTVRQNLQIAVGVIRSLEVDGEASR